MRDFRLCIDPGHGGQDRGGGSHKPLDEADYCLSIALGVQNRLIQEGICHCFLTRVWDCDLSQSQRATIAAQQHADLIISLHVNAANDKDKDGKKLPRESYAVLCHSLKGATAYHWPGNVLVEAYNKAVLSRFPEVLRRRNIISYSAGVTSLDPGPILIIRQHKAPTSLIEMGYGSNTHDREALLRPSNKAQIINAIADGLNEYWRLKEL